MGKLCQVSPELWPLIDVILFSYIELIFRGGVSCLPAALLFAHAKNKGEYQLHGKGAADQHLCFCYIDNIIPLLPKSKISSL